MTEIIYCSFCGKSQHEVRQIIAGPTTFICDECVDLCTAIIAERRGGTARIPQSVRERCWGSVIQGAERGYFMSEGCLIAAADELARLSLALKDDRRARLILEHGRGPTVEKYWARGTAVTAYLLDGIVPGKIDQLSAPSPDDTVNGGAA